MQAVSAEFVSNRQFTSSKTQSVKKTFKEDREMSFNAEVVALLSRTEDETRGIAK